MYALKCCFSNKMYLPLLRHERSDMSRQTNSDEQINIV